MTLREKSAVVLAGAGFEDIEFWYPVLRCREAGASVTVLGVDGPDVCSSRSGYPVVPDSDLATFPDRPTYVFVPGFVGYPFDDLRKRTADHLCSWAESGALLVGTSVGVAAFALADLVAGVTVSCPASVEGLIVEAGGIVSGDPVTISQRFATAASVDDIALLFRRLSEA